MASFCRKFLIFLLLVNFCFEIFAGTDGKKDDLYELLGVSKDASEKEIRRAFKQLALKMHPDKNKDDKDADAKFIKLAKAYEILKEPETRKRYDLHGDTGDSSDSHEYQSYSYYQNDFGLYDDDSTIVTLSRADYEINVVGSTQAWFINFYSPQCSHCHTLAPVWRKLSKALEGVVRIAAVNCQEDWALCNQLRIRGYPTVLYYEKGAGLYEGEDYHGEKSIFDMQEFILSKLTIKVQTVNEDVWDIHYKEQSWLLFLCPEGVSCPEPDTRLKVAAAIEGLMQVGMVTDPALCKRIYKSYKKTPTVFWKVNKIEKGDVEATESHGIDGSDAKEIVDKLLDLLPDPKTLDEEAFRDARTQLRLGSDKAWLICFYLGHATELNIQLKRLPTLISNINIGLVHCGRSSALCSSLHVSHYPAWGVLKPGGAFELHHGKDALNDIAAFARDSSKSTNLHALSPADYHKLKRDGEVWFIDWYAPWCPPCKKLMPEIRRASQHFTSEQVQFGTIDCTLHSTLCTQSGIQSYPTTALYNGSKVQYFHGIPNEESIVDFVENLLNPTVIELDESSFAQVVRKPRDEIWVIDYFAPWCGACQMLSPQYRVLGKMMKDVTNVKIATVNCDENNELCNAQNIRAYPTIRLYPLGSKGLNTMSIYNGHFDANALKRWIVSFLPSPVEALNGESFKKQILTKKYVLPWLVDFYAPWCGFCTHFEPEFITVAQRLEGRVRSGKVNCEDERFFCAEMRINSYPTVKLYFSPDDNFLIQSYNAKDIIKIVKGLLDSRKGKHDEL